MPAYNAEKYIGAAIESVLNQTFSDWELIIADDCSTDSTPEIAKSYAAQDSRIRVLKTAAPSGSPYQPRKAAISVALADIVSPLDADDTIAPSNFEQMLRMREETGANIVYPVMYVSDSDGGYSQFVPAGGNIIGASMAGKEAVKYTLDGWRISCNGGLIDRRLYMEIFENSDSSISHGYSDEFLTRQLLYYADKVSFSPEKYLYRINTESVSRKKSIKLFHFLINNRLLHDFIGKRYAHDSATYLRMQRQLFHGIFDALRLKNSHDFDQKRYDEEIVPLIYQNIDLIDWSLIRPHETKKYFYLLKILSRHIGAAGMIVKVGDKLFKSLS